MEKLSPANRIALLIGRVVLAFLAWFLFWMTVVRLFRRYVHFPAPPFISFFLDGPIRKAIQPPEQLVTEAGILSGMTVLELGSGPGTFTIEAARRVQPGGRVIAVDIEPRMLELLQSKAARCGVDNVEIHGADAYHLPMPDSSVDLALMVTVIAEIPNRERALAELWRVLKPGGALVVSELFLDPDFPRLSTVVRWCEKAGFHHESSHDHRIWYVVTFRKQMD